MRLVGFVAAVHIAPALLRRLGLGLHGVLVPYVTEVIYLIRIKKRYSIRQMQATPGKRDGRRGCQCQGFLLPVMGLGPVR